MAIVWPFVGIGCGVLIVVVAAVIGFAVMPTVIDDQVEEATQLVKGTDQFERWAELPQPLHFKVYIFEIQNPDEVHLGLETPIVREKGPYVYRQTKWKTNIQFSDDNERVSFDGNRKYEFDEAASGDLKDTDEIHILNPVMNSILQTVEMDPVQKHLLMLITSLLGRIFNATNFFLKTTPRALLFEGINFCEAPTGVAIDFCKTVLATESENIVDHGTHLSFALFRHKHTKIEGHFQVNTGISDSALTYLVEKFNGEDIQNVWLNGVNENNEQVTSKCNKIYGSDGNHFPPFPKEENPLASLQIDVCRIISVYYDGEAEYKGITGMVYRTGKDFVEEVGPEFGNECLCVNYTQGIDQVQENGCMYKGAVDLFTCLHGPLVLTKPHMLDANEIYSKDIVGMNPDTEKHGTIMVIEPYTGTVLQGFKRLQLNQFLRPIFRIILSESYKPVLMPILWVDEGIELNDKMITLLNEELYDTLEIVTIVVWVVIGVGIALTVGCTLWYFVRPKKGVV